MKKIFLLTIISILLLNTDIFAQRIIFQSDFENITLNSDSLPTNWVRYDVDGLNPNIKWAVRDTGCIFHQGAGTRVRAHNSAKSLEIPWYAGSGGNYINDDFVFSDTFTVHNGDSLIFWMLIGSDSTYQNYIDTMQVGYAPLQEPVLWTKFETIRSLDSNNVWTLYKYDLSSLAGQSIAIGFRYYMDVSIDGLWCNIDDLFIGNRSEIGINQIGTNVPDKFALKQNYPNPFNPVTNIEFDLPKKEFVNLKIYNSIGEEIAVLVNEVKGAGTYKVDWDAKNLPSGAYYYRITAGDFVQTNKMMLVK